MAAATAAAAGTVAASLPRGAYMGRRRDWRRGRLATVIALALALGTLAGAADVSAAATAAAATAAAAAAAATTQDPFAAKLREVPGGIFVMGNSRDVQPASGELAAQTVQVQPFKIDAWAATNEEFRQFVRATRYKTDSERFGWSFVLDYQATESAKRQTESQVQGATFWLAVPHAYWRAPDGPGSGISDRLDHPAVHLSFADAKAYCAWRGLRLPTETEWEYAARGGLQSKRYPWGDSVASTKGWRMNIWQGEFPGENTLEDGFATTCPARAFDPNDFDLYNMLGNVWEWTATKWSLPGATPPGQAPTDAVERVLRGGSFLDSETGQFNHRVDLNTRMGNTEDSASSNTGARCAWSATKPAKGYAYPKSPKKPSKGAGLAGLDQAQLQKIVEEGGVEALQEFLGDRATVTTPGELKQRQDAARRELEALEREAKRQGVPGQAVTENIEPLVGDDDHIEL